MEIQFLLRFAPQILTVNQEMVYFCISLLMSALTFFRSQLEGTATSLSYSTPLAKECSKHQTIATCVYPMVFLPLFP